MKIRSTKGFTLIELLIVVAIIGIIAAIAMPGLLRARMSGNEASAIGSLRSINSAQANFASSCASGYFAGLLTDLGSGTTATSKFLSARPHRFGDVDEVGLQRQHGWRRLGDHATTPLPHGLGHLPGGRRGGQPDHGGQHGRALLRHDGRWHGLSEPERRDHLQRRQPQPEHGQQPDSVTGAEPLVRYEVRRYGRRHRGGRLSLLRLCPGLLSSRRPLRSPRVCVRGVDVGLRWRSWSPSPRPGDVQHVLHLRRPRPVDVLLAEASLAARHHPERTVALVAWQTGFPFAADFSRGAPRYQAHRRAGTAEAAVPSAVLVVGAPESLAEPLRSSLNARTRGGDRPSSERRSVSGARGHRHRVAGIHEAGIGYRMDDIPLPLQAPLPGPRSAEALLRDLLAGLTRRCRGSAMIGAQLRIVGGTVHDPANGVDGEVRDICIDDGPHRRRRAAAARRRIDARGMVVMPGGVDIHSPRRQRQRQPGAAAAARRAPARSGAGAGTGGRGRPRARAPAVPCPARSRPAIATPASATRRCSTRRWRRSPRGTSHAEFDDTPIVDGGFFVLLGNDEYLLRLIDAGERERARDYAAWVLGAAGGYAIKIVNPGGVELWKRGARDRHGARRRRSARSGVTPRAILETLVDAGNALGCRTPAHIHCNNLGAAGNVADHAGEHARASEGRRAHFTHLQFHSYGSGAGQAAGARARAQLIEYVNAHPEVSGDVGQVMFGPATTLTRRRRRSSTCCTTAAAGSGSTSTSSSRPAAASSPTRYKERAAVAALQWAVGLELFLLAGRSLAGGAVHRSSERRIVHGVPGADPAADGPDLPRRAAQAGQPAAAGRERAGRRPRPRVHPQRDRHHHPRGPGPAARPDAQRAPRRRRGRRRDGVRARTPDIARMFATPRYVIKGGALVVEEGPAPPRAGGPAAPRAPRLRRRRACRTCAVLRRVRHGAVRQLSRCGTLPTSAPLELADVEIRGVFIEDTFAEAFAMRAARVVITAATRAGRARRRSR